MPPFADIYVLAESRTEAVVGSFLTRFAPERVQSADEYWIPQHAATPQKVFRTASELVAHCCSSPFETQSVYWRRVGAGDPAHVMVFFTSDAGLIFGLSVNESSALHFFAELRTHAHSDIGYITVETPPPETAAEFRQIAYESSA